MKFYIFPVLIYFVLAGASCESAFPDASKIVFDWKVDSSNFDFAKYVNPIIGTDGHGHTFPGATAPFGMVQLSPDTRVDGSWDGCSGYHYSDDTIYGFSHTHLSGTGCSDYGDILFMPGNGKINFSNGTQTAVGYRSHFSHQNEIAKAGYYSVVLDNSLTKVELTASPRVGMHRYSFNSESENWILLDLTHRDEVLDSKFKLVNDHTIEGYRFSKAWAADQRVYFYAEFSEPFESVPMEKMNSDSTVGKNVKCAFRFKNLKQVILKVAISAVSTANAKLNMQTEIPNFEFDAVHQKVLRQWNNELGKIEVRTADENKKNIFYTALYHSFIVPNLYCDVNGEFRGRDNKIHVDTLHEQYTVFSLWDTYRALHPLFTIIQPQRDQDFVRTFIKQYEKGFKLPVWELSANETNCMIGYHAVPVIVDAWMKGLVKFDTATAYEAMKASAMQQTNGLDTYHKFGFVAAEREGESVSKTLEYAYDDWCIALAAQRMHRDDDYNYFLHRSHSWRNLYDSKTGFFRPRLNNSFVETFDPSEVNFHLTEANSWQYSLAVQHDVPGLIAAHGGDKKFIQFLDDLFSVSSKTSGREQADITGLIGQYAQGNEPSHHMAYLYNYTSQPWKSQKIVSQICNQLYTNQPDGLCGNEDCGQMSAWYVLSSIGIYQVAPGTNDFQIGSPQFPEVIFHLENGNKFKLIAKNVSATNSYLDTVIYKNRTASIFNTISFAEINNGGELVLPMSNKFFYQIPDLKKTQSSPCSFLMAPIIQNTSGRTFTSSRSIQLGTDCENALIHFCLDNGTWQDYSKPFIIDKRTKIYSYASLPSGEKSDTSFAEFFKAPNYGKIVIKNKFANQYAAGGNRALVDGIRGGASYRTGDWQGYEGIDLDVVIDLGVVQKIKRIAIGFLQDQNSWIFFPKEVTFYSSLDGKVFSEMVTEKNKVSQHSTTTLLNDFITSSSKDARYIKVLAKNAGVCPDWHPGRGNLSWIFADELSIE